MTCEDCAKSQTEIREGIDQILQSQVQSQAKIDWIVDTVSKLATGFQQMMDSGGPLAMLKMMRKGGKE